MKQIGYIIFILLGVSCSKGDPNEGKSGSDEPGALGKTYRGNVVLKTQQEINDFGAEKYVDITGNLTISEGTPASITDLTPLAPLKRVVGSMYIQKNENLKSITGFPNLSAIDAGLIISENNNLERIDGFENLQQVGGDIAITNNDSSFGIFGFSNLSLVKKGVYITNLFGKNILQLSAFENLKTIEQDLVLGNIDGNLDKFGKIENIGNDLVVQRINEVEDLRFLSSLKSVGRETTFTLNGALKTLNGFNEVVTIGADLIILGNPSLANLDGLNGLSSCGDLKISTNGTLADFCGLQNLFDSGWANQTFVIDNAYNPSVSQLRSGNCAN
ncbi:MAG: hypothetical protein ACFCUL_03770 [Flavobacteriaceae bacterium]